MHHELEYICFKASSTFLSTCMEDQIGYPSLSRLIIIEPDPTLSKLSLVWEN